MFPTLSKSARRTAMGVAILALASVGLRVIYEMQIDDRTFGQIAWDMVRFFTILTNLLVAASFAIAALPRTEPNAPWLAALTLAIVLVGAVYHVLLAHLVEFSGVGLIADHGLHTVVPIACALWWIVYAPKRPLVFSDLPMFVVWPAVYVAYALARGAFDGEYPYPFMDLSQLSAPEVATNLGGLTAVVLLGGVVMVGIGRYADR